MLVLQESLGLSRARGDVCILPESYLQHLDPKIQLYDTGFEPSSHSEWDSDCKTHVPALHYTVYQRDSTTPSYRVETLITAPPIRSLNQVPIGFELLFPRGLDLPPHRVTDPGARTLFLMQMRSNPDPLVHHYRYPVSVEYISGIPTLSNSYTSLSSKRVGSRTHSGEMPSGSAHKFCDKLLKLSGVSLRNNTIIKQKKKKPWHLLYTFTR